MSEYSLDSLENVEADSLEERVSDNDSDNGCNLVAIKDKFDKNASFYVNPIPPTSTQLKEESLPTGRFVDDAPDDTTTTVHGGRNPIIASRRGFARRGRQQQECRATPAESWLCIRKSNDADVAAVGRREEGGADRRSRRRCCPRVRTSSGATTEQRSPGNVTRNSRRGSSDGMKADKRLDNVLVPSTWSRNPIGPPSYSELYRRRLSTTSAYPRIRSPEGSTLSICGDSQLEDLSLDEGHTSLPATSRDDSSEFSFYRRFLEAHIDHAEILVRSCELRSSCETVAKFPDSVSDSKLKRSGYRPYTIEEYRSLSVSRPDRSLGPDKDEMLTKACLGTGGERFVYPITIGGSPTSFPGATGGDAGPGIKSFTVFRVRVAVERGRIAFPPLSAASDRETSSITLVSRMHVCHPPMIVDINYFKLTVALFIKIAAAVTAITGVAVVLSASPALRVVSMKRRTRKADETPADDSGDRDVCGT
ncbi:hypothetical protein X777_03533 [Ooceraea biroi]|uniref:Uncharacterized protein n=1 Tax=Ooceraea biroi TaxID=2015173 RepID=A0A026WKM3_OOCBI|nr:hypothetical protein X777_03533 [Ooceraea biroi]